MKIQGLPVYRIVNQPGSALYIPLPRELWRECGSCDCEHCKGGVGFWDTLGVATTGILPRTWTLHAPELHLGKITVGQFVWGEKGAWKTVREEDRE